MPRTGCAEHAFRYCRRSRRGFARSRSHANRGINPNCGNERAPTPTGVEDDLVRFIVRVESLNQRLQDAAALCIRNEEGGVGRPAHRTYELREQVCERGPVMPARKRGFWRRMPESRVVPERGSPEMKCRRMGRSLVYPDEFGDRVIPVPGRVKPDRCFLANHVPGQSGYDRILHFAGMPVQLLPGRKVASLPAHGSRCNLKSPLRRQARVCGGPDVNNARFYYSTRAEVRSQSTGQLLRTYCLSVRQAAIQFDQALEAKA